MKAVPHRHVVFSIPKILRRYFLYDRKLLSDLSRCGWEALKAFYTTGVRDTEAVPGAVIAIQTFGDLLGFHPHLHILVSDGCFHENGMFTVCPAGDAKTLEQVFRHKVLRMLRMTYHRETGQVQYRSKDKKKIHPELTNKDFQSITPFDTRSKMLPAFVSQKGILINSIQLFDVSKQFVQIEPVDHIGENILENHFRLFFSNQFETFRFTADDLACKQFPVLD